MAWVNMGSQGLNHNAFGYMGTFYFQYDNSSTGNSRPCRVIFAVAAKRGVWVTLYEFKINGNGTGSKSDPFLSANSGAARDIDIWSGNLNAGNCSCSFRITFTDGGGGPYYFNFGGNLPSGYKAPNTPSVVATASGYNVTVKFGTSSYGVPSSGTTYLYGTGSNSTNRINSTSGVGTSAGTHSMTVTQPGTYYFRAKSKNTANYESGYSGQATVTYDSKAPNTPSISGSTLSTTSNSISFSTTSWGFPNSGSLILYGDTSSTPNTIISMKTAGSNTFTHTGLTAGTTYYYRAYATNGYKDSSFSRTIAITTRYESPSNVSAVLNNSSSDGQANSTISVGSWGAKSSAGSYQILNATNSNSLIASSTSNTFNWTIPLTSTNQNATAVNAWKARAINNHNEYTDSATYYLATPSAPKSTYVGHTGTNPFLTRNVSVTYSGGLANSTTANTAAIKKWVFTKTRLSDNTSETVSRNSTSRSESLNYYMSDFTVGSNYSFTTTVYNTYGAAGRTVSYTYYCPSGVGGSVTELHPDQATLKASVNAPGGEETTTSSSITCYQLKYGIDKNNLTQYTKIQTDPYFYIEDLKPDTVYYYQITAWNTLGLSNNSPVLSFTTGGRYLPIVRTYRAIGHTPGADIAVTIGRTGGLTPNELTINRITLELRAVGDTAWTMMKDIKNLSVTATTGYTIINAWTNYLQKAGNYEMRITAYNQYDAGFRIFTLEAPTVPTVSTPTLENNVPTQLRLTASTTAGTARVNHFSMRLVGIGMDISKNETVNIPSGQTKSVTLISPNYLLFNTTYTIYVTARDDIGMWNMNPNGVKITTPPRITWHMVLQDKEQGTTVKSATPIFRTEQIQKTTTDVYYVSRSSLGDFVKPNANLTGMRLHFISHPLFYRPESVASVSLSDGTRLAYDYDAGADMYKFGIWQGDDIQITFFDGEQWVLDRYDFTTVTTVLKVEYNGKGINASSAFSTTRVEEI